MAGYTLSFVNVGPGLTANLADLSEDGHFASYTQFTGPAGGQTETLWVVDLNSRGGIIVASTPVIESGTELQKMFGGALSADGRYISYSIDHENFSAGSGDVFRQDLQTGATKQLTTSATDPDAGAIDFRSAGISGDGGTVLIDVERFSHLTNPSPIEEIDIEQVASGATTQIAKWTLGGFDFQPLDLSANGRYVVLADNLGDVEVKDTQTGSVTSLPVPFKPDINPPDFVFVESVPGDISANGRYVAFEVDRSYADGHKAADVYVEDMSTGAVTLASSARDGTSGNGLSTLLGLSANGRFVLFSSKANNLVPDDNDGLADLFVKYLDTGAVTLVARSDVQNARISADGSTIVFNQGGSIFLAKIQPPTLTIDPISGDDAINAVEAGSPVVVSGTSDAIGKLVFVSGDAPGGVFQHFATVQPDGTWSASFNVTGLVDGIHSFSASVTDDAGATQTTSRDAQLDRVPPTLTIDTMAGDDNVNAVEAPAATVTLQSDAGGQTATLEVDGIVVGSATVPPPVVPGVSLPFFASFDARTIADGPHTLSAIVTDAAGNVTTASHAFTIDRTPPLMTIDPVTGDNVVTWNELGGPISISGSSDAIGQAVTVNVGGTLLTTTVVPGALWQTSIDPTALPQGVLTISASVTDSSGNIATASESVDVHTLELRLVSTNTADAGVDATNPTISLDGRYVAFDSFGFGPLTGETFVKDLQTGAVTLASAAADGTPADDGSLSVPFISGNGRFVAFTSPADNLVAGDTNGDFDAFVKDLQTGDISRITIDPVLQPRGTAAAISDDGSKVAFLSDQDLYVEDTATGKTTFLTTYEFTPPEDRRLASFSADGRTIAYVVKVPLPGFPGTFEDEIFVTDLTTGTSTLASTSATGALPDANVGEPSLSADGKMLVFGSSASNLLPGVSGDQIYVKDLTTGALQLASSTASGDPGDFHSFNGAISPDGKSVIFVSQSSNLGPHNLAPFERGIYVKDLTTGQIELISSGRFGPANDSSDFFASISADGHVATFASDATNLLSPLDPWSGQQIFAANLRPDAVVISPIAGDGKVNAAEAAGALAISGTSTGIGDKVSVSVDGGAFTGQATVQPDGHWSLAYGGSLSQGTHTVHAGTTDALGFTSQSDATFAVDTISPTLALSSDKVALTPADTALITFTFSEDVTGFDLGDVHVAGGTLGALAVENGHIYHARFTPAAGEHSASFSVAADAVTDLAGNANATASLTLGLAIDGYIAGATVFADTNGNGLRDPGEASATTDGSGAFLLTGGSGPIVVTGGIDIGTGLPFDGSLTAPVGSSVVTPLATLVSILETRGVVNAEQKVLAAFALDPAPGHLTGLDPIEATLQGEAGGKAALAADAIVLDTVNLTAATIGRHDAAQFAAAFHDAFTALAGLVSNASAALDLTDPGQIETFIGATLALDGMSLDAGTVGGLAQIIAATNAAVLGAAQTNDGIDALKEITAIELVVRGAASDALGNLNGDPAQLQAAVSAFADHLDSAIATARSHTGDVDGPDHSSPPQATNDDYVVAQGGTLNVAAAGVLANDTDADGDSLTALLTGQPSHGTVNLHADGSFSYVPDAQYSGPDSFAYAASDGSGRSNAAAVSIRVTGGSDKAPVAADGTGSGDEDTPVTGQAIATDSDTPQGNLGFSLVGTDGGARHGTVQLNANGAFTYLPAANYNGTDSFSFKVNDGNLDSNVATIGLTINAVNDAPVVAPLGANLGEDGPAFSQNLLAGASDPDSGDQLSLASLDASVTTTGGRTLLLGSDYTLNGSTLALTNAGFAKFNDLSAAQTDQAVFHFGVSDGHVTISNTLSLTVAGLDDAPTLNIPTANQTATAGKPYLFTLPGTTFSDVDNGDHLTLAATLGDGSALPHWLSFDAASGTLSGTPGGGDVGGFDVKLTATDTSARSASETFHFTIDAATVNHPPVITSDGSGNATSVIITDNSRYVATVHATDPDPSTTVKYAIVGGVDQKLFSIDPKTGLLTFKSDPRDGHNYQVTVAASDGAAQDTQTIKVQVASGVLEFGNSGSADNFVFKPHFGLEIVNGFDATSSNHDVIELDHALFRHAVPGMSSTALLDLIQDHSFQLGTDVIITTDTRDIIDLRNTNLHHLSAHDFVIS